MDELSADRDPFEVIAESFLARFRAGERPSIEEYEARHPELAEQIRELMPALVMIEQDLTTSPDVATRSRRPLPARLGDYLILREIGRGGMGVVYEAEQISLGRHVALKVLTGHGRDDRRSRERFRREARAAAKLHHTNIVPVFEVGEDRDVVFYAMQLIRGQGLDQVVEELAGLRRLATALPREAEGTRRRATIAETPGEDDTAARSRKAGSILVGTLATEVPSSTRGDGPASPGSIAAVGPDPEGPGGPRAIPEAGASAAGASGSAMLPDGKAVSEVSASGPRLPFFRSVTQIGRQAAQGLAHAHARGIIHRDIKPSNLMLDVAGVVWITDFGLAKADDDGLTATGDLLGTVRYMAPERFRGQGDGRADIYALGLTLYELLTLRPVFEMSDRLGLIERIKNVEPARPRSIDGQIPRDLETIVLKAIDKDPARRYTTADEMAEDLRRFLADEPIKARQVSTSEQYWRWARRNPVIATLGATLVALLVLLTVGSLLAANRFARMAGDQSNSAAAERSARLEADQARSMAEAARVAAQAETYRAVLSEVKALRAGHQLGWREKALGDLARLVVMPTPRRDVVELRTEAVACIGDFGVREVARLQTLDNTAHTIDWSPDSRTLLSVTKGGELELWDLSAPSRSRRLVGLVRGSNAHYALSGLARFLPDGGLAFIDAKGDVSFLGPEGRGMARPSLTRPDARAVVLRADSRSRRLAVAWDDGRVDLHDLGSGAPPRRIDRNISGDFAISPDGRWLAIERSRTRVDLVTIDGQADEFTLPARGVGLSTLRFSPDSETLACLDGRAVMVYDLASRRELLRLTGHKETVTSIAFSPDGSMLATTCGDAITRIWDARDGRPIASLPGPWYMHCLAFSPDGNHLAASSKDQISLYQLEGRRAGRRLIGHRFGVERLAFHPALPRLFSSSDDHDVATWDANSGRRLARWAAHKSFVSGLAVSPDGKRIASGRGDYHFTDDDPVRLWDSETGALGRTLSGNTQTILALTFDPEGRHLASGDAAGLILVLDLETGRIDRREALVGSPVGSLAFLDDGRSLLVGQEDGAISLLDPDQPGPSRRVVLPRGCSRLVVDRRGDRALIGDPGGSLTALSLRDLSVVHRLDRAHESDILSLALSRDGLFLATSGKDRRIVLRDPATFEPLLSFPEWTGPVLDVTFDSTGRWIAFGGTDSEIGLWDLDLVRAELASLGLELVQRAGPAGGTGGPAKGIVPHAPP